MTVNDLSVAIVLLCPVVAGFALWFLRLRGVYAEAVIALAIGFAAASGLGLAAGVLGRGPVTAFNRVVTIDQLGAYLVALTLVVAILAVAASPRYLRHEIRAGHLPAGVEGRYYALLLWFVTSLLVIPMVDNLGLLWVAVEASTVLAALLVGINRSPEAIEAAWKYLILGTVGVGFALLATLLAYASSVQVMGDSSDALNYTTLIQIAPHLNPALMKLAFVFALAGYGLKTGLAPFHTWLPDAHSQAPSPISALLSGVSLLSALYALTRFHLVTAACLGPQFSSYLLVSFGLISIAVALPFMIRQEDVKRLLAYSSVEHMGLLALGLGFGTPLALVGVTLHAGLHALTKSTLFLAAGELVQQYGSARLSRLRATLTAAPIAGTTLGVGILMLGGMPPSGIFATEFAIIVGGVAGGYTIVAAVAAVLLALCFVAMAVHGSRLMWGRVPSDLASEQAQSLEQAPASGWEQPNLPAQAEPSSPSSAPADLVSWLSTGLPPERTGIFGKSLMVARFGVPLAVVAILGVWTPGPLNDALDSIKTILAVIHG